MGAAAARDRPTCAEFDTRAARAASDSPGVELGDNRAGRGHPYFEATGGMGPGGDLIIPADGEIAGILPQSCLDPVSQHPEHGCWQRS